jgi:hypothetical protein
LKRIVLLLAVTAISVLALAVPAFAQGQVERGPEHARSICSFSGLNEQPTGNINPDGTPNPADDGRVQSYGDYVKEGHIKPSEVKSGAPSPGTFCNPEKGPFEGPFEQHLP